MKKAPSLDNIHFTEKRCNTQTQYTKNGYESKVQSSNIVNNTQLLSGLHELQSSGFITPISDSNKITKDPFGSLVSLQDEVS